MKIKAIILLLNTISVIMLTAICINMGIIVLPEEIAWIEVSKDLLENDYFINISCTFATAYLLFLFQVQYSKRKLKNDFRCNEILQDVSDGIRETEELIALVKKEEIGKDDGDKQDSKARSAKRAKQYIEFYGAHQHEFYFSNLGLTYYNNDILIESVQSVFFINLNFKLLSIVNHIKNRKPNLDKTFPKIKEKYKVYQENPTEELGNKLGFEIEHFLIDLKFMASYWKSLLDYLGYDPLPTKLFIDAFNERFPEDEDKASYHRLSLAKQYRVVSRLRRRVTILCLLHKVKSFFD